MRNDYGVMPSRSKLILQGIGSLIDICPQPARLEQIIITDQAELMRLPWERVGVAIRGALDEYQAAGEEEAQ